MYTYLMPALQKWSQVKIHKDLRIFNTFICFDTNKQYRHFVHWPLWKSDAVLFYISKHGVDVLMFLTYRMRYFLHTTVMKYIDFNIFSWSINIICHVKNLKVRISAHYFFVVKLKLPNISKGYIFSSSVLPSSHDPIIRMFLGIALLVIHLPIMLSEMKLSASIFCQ
jgi:hypothetical protein